MIDLREHLQELADAAARYGTTPGPAAAMRRGRRRRRGAAGAVAAVLAVAMAVAIAVGTGAAGRLLDRPTLPVTNPGTPLPSLSHQDLGTTLSGPRSPEAVAFKALAAEVRRCRGGYTEPSLVGYFRSAELGRLAMVVAKKPAPGETTICWAAGVFGLDGSGERPGRVQPVSTSSALTATVGASGGHGTVHGHAGKEATRVRVRFRDQPAALDIPVIQSWAGYLANLYVGLHPPGWVPVEVTTFDATGRRLAGCTIGSRGGVLPRCPGS